MLAFVGLAKPRCNMQKRCDVVDMHDGSPIQLHCSISKEDLSFFKTFIGKKDVT